MRTSDDDIAVTGLGVRLPPEIDDPVHLWRVLTGGESVSGLTVSGPDGLRLAADGDGETAGLRRGIDQFDPVAFGIGRAEARDIDPQQRLVLESTWDCLADAGIPWTGLRGRAVGVFAGAYAQDWLFTQARGGAPFSGYVGTGTAHSMLSNRLSYLLDIHGPSLTVDTACSSSLTALHLAIGALRRGECEVAVVTAVALGFDETYRSMTTSSLPFSPRGTCRPFDASADGIIRGEGAVTLLLELDRARGSRPSRATLLGSAVNHDGRTNGLTAPSAAAQTSLLRAALADARVRAADVGYLEAHGTGTILGDPIETKAIAAVYAGDDLDRDGPLLIGSVKGTLGHLEAASGLAGVASAILALQHSEVPIQTGFETINPAIDLCNGRLAVPRERRILREDQLVGVSSFGFGGSNAHVVLGRATPAPKVASESDVDPAALHVLTLSAADADGLHARRALARERLVAPDHHPDVLSRTTRANTAQRHRYAWSAGSAEELAAAVLDQAGGPGDGRTAPAARAGALWVFSGQGSHWFGMGDELLRVPRLRASWERWEREVRSATGWSLAERLARHTPGTTSEDQIAIAAVQLAIAELLETWGQRPSAVVGHSMGEVTAAVVAGSLTSAEGFALLAQRGRWLESAAVGGRMLAIALSVDEVEGWIESHDGIGVGAINGPRSTVVTGTAEGIADLKARLSAAGVTVRPLDVVYGFHSGLLDAVPDAERTTAVHGARGTVAQFSTVTSLPLDLERENGYWWRNVREPVRFADALATALVESGSRCVVEISPRPVLQHDIEAIAEQQIPGEAVVVLTSTSRRDSLSSSLGALAAGLYRYGFNLDPTALAPAPKSWKPPIPLAWQRQRYWPEAPVRVDPLPQRPPLPSDTVVPVLAATAPGTETARPDDGRGATALAAEIRDHVCALVSGSLDDHPTVSADVPLAYWELESLAIVTLRNAVEQRFGVAVPLSLLLQSPTPRRLADDLAGVPHADDTTATTHNTTATEGDDAATTSVTGPAPSNATADVALSGDPLDQLTDIELEALLADLESSTITVGLYPNDDPR